MTDLAGTQISSLMETLPGIAQVLRSPVADAFVSLIRAATGRGEFNLADADELMKYAIRRNLMTADEAERILAEAQEAMAAAVAVAKAKGLKAAARAAKRTAAKSAKSAKPAAKKAVRKAAKPAPKRKPVAKK